MRSVRSQWMPAAFAVLAGACTVDGVALLPGPGDGVGDEAATDGATEVGDEVGESDSWGSDVGDDATDESSSDEGDESDTDESTTDTGATQSEACTVSADGLDGFLPCTLPEAATELAPVVQWEWTGPGGEDSVLTTPLVANLDDDNGDGWVDLCDTPDVLVAAVAVPAAKHDIWPRAHLYVIDGKTGHAKGRFEKGIDGAVNPAIGDLDGDGQVEIVALEAAEPNSPYTLTPRRLIAFDPEGNVLWHGDHWSESYGGGAIALADLDADGVVEILAPDYVANAHGALLWAPEEPALAYSMPVAVDLDLDLQLEVLFGGTAYEPDGTWLFDAGLVPTNFGASAVANFDADAYPEIYVQFLGLHGVFEHDGTFKYLCPSGQANLASSPIAVRDLDGDTTAELMFAYKDQLYTLGTSTGQCKVEWAAGIDATEALSGGTVFDLLGDGRAETLYADNSSFAIYDYDGTKVFEIDRTARESIANPIVADVDGDGAAEILVSSSRPVGSLPTEVPSVPSLVVLEAGEGGFVPTRRIWNQHTYHYSNVREDGGVPKKAPHHWWSVNGFRTNPQMQPGDKCIDKP